MLTDAPGASGVPSEITPADCVVLNAPPFGCDGGCSSTVPSIVTEHGAGFGEQVPASLIPATTTDVDVRERKSAKPDGAGNVLTSMILKRSLVIGLPVLLTTRRRISSVPNVELFAGSDVKSRTRFGGKEAACDESTIKTAVVAFRSIGDDRFSGPGAPRR